MPDFRKVRPRDPLRIPAETYNAFVDTANIVRGFGGGKTPRKQHFHPSPVIVTVANDSDTDVERCGVMAVREPLILPEDNELEFQNHLVMKAVVPTTDDFGKCGILLDSIPAKRTASGEDDIFSFGRLMIAGACRVQLDVINTAHRYADRIDGDETQLRSAPGGHAKIYWKEDGSGSKWAVVLIGFPNTPQMCLVQANGVDGNGDPTYDIFDLDDTAHDNALNGDPIVPEDYRDPDVSYNAAESGEFQVDKDGEIFLKLFNEYPDAEDCAS